MSRMAVFQKNYLNSKPETNSVESDQLIAYKNFITAPQWTSVSVQSIVTKKKNGEPTVYVESPPPDPKPVTVQQLAELVVDILLKNSYLNQRIVLA